VSASDPLSTTPLDPSAAAGARDPLAAPPSPADVAPLFPQLEVLGLIGRGGMGIVYKARHKALDRLVALKILPWHPDRPPTFAERFEREARALARLQHAGIVAVHDSGRIGDYHYLVMEYVDGPNLRQAVAHTGWLEGLPNGQTRPAVIDGHVTPSVAAQIITEVCQALQYAHGQGVIHRDIKPENILYSGKFKVADFGLAKLIAPGPLDRELTGTSQAMGTLNYMAPEQLERPQEVDHRADVYAVGVVLYELLTGKLPRGSFPPPSRTPGVPASFDAVVVKALAQAPAERYASAEALSTDLAAAWGAAQAASQPAGAMPDWGTKMFADLFGANWAGAKVVNHPGFFTVVSPPPPPPLPPVQRHLPWRTLLGAMGLFSMGWVAATHLWNLGALGLVLAAVIMLWMYRKAFRGALAHLPELAQALAKLDAPTRGLRWGLSGALFLTGCGVLLFAGPFYQDARVQQHCNNAYPLVQGGTSHWHSSGEWVLPVAARDFFPPALAPVPPQDALQPLTRLNLKVRRAGSSGDFAQAWLVLLIAGVVACPLLIFATLAVPGRRAFWSAGVGLLAAALLPWLILVGIGVVWGETPTLGKPLLTMECPVGHVLIVDELRDWCAQNHYELLGGCEMGLGPDGKAVLTVFQVRSPSVLARWWQSGFCQGQAPDLLVLCVTSHVGKPTWVRFVPVGARRTENEVQAVFAITKDLLDRTRPRPEPGKP